MPASLRSKFLLGKLNLIEDATREKTFQGIADVLAAALKDRHGKLERAKSPATVLKFEAEIEHVEKRMRYLATLKESLARYSARPKEDPPTGPTTGETSPTWFDLFKEIAERQCEPWRRALVAEAGAVELASPGSINLKTLWNIAMLETSSFELFGAFLSSSLYLDGYPVILYDKSHHGAELIDVGMDRHTSLAVMLGSLIEHGLVSYDHFQVESDQPVSGYSATRRFVLRHITGKGENTLPFIQFVGYHCTDLGIDLARLCPKPLLNDLADKSLVELEASLSDQTELVIEFLPVDA